MTRLLYVRFGSSAPLQVSASHFRPAPPINGHHQTGAVGPVGAGSLARIANVTLPSGKSSFPAAQTTAENSPTGKSAKTCPSPPAKIFRLTRRANHHYKLAPSHPDEGRIARRHERAVGCDGRDSVGRARDRRAGFPVSDRPARGRTTLLTVFARTRLTARGQARPLAWTVADGEVVWSWRPDAGVKSCGDASGPTGFEMHRQSGKATVANKPVTGESSK
jgi:hypothetical protein